MADNDERQREEELVRQINHYIAENNALARELETAIHNVNILAQNVDSMAQDVVKDVSTLSKNTTTVDENITVVNQDDLTGIAAAVLKRISTIASAPLFPMPKSR